MRLYYRGLKNYLYYQNRVALKGAIKATIRAIIIRIQYRGLNNDFYYLGGSLLYWAPKPCSTYSGPYSTDSRSRVRRPVWDMSQGLPWP